MKKIMKLVAVFSAVSLFNVEEVRSMLPSGTLESTPQTLVSAFLEKVIYVESPEMPIIKEHFEAQITIISMVAEGRCVLEDIIRLDDQVYVGASDNGGYRFSHETEGRAAFHCVLIPATAYASERGFIVNGDGQLLLAAMPADASVVHELLHCSHYKEDRSAFLQREESFRISAISARLVMAKLRQDPTRASDLLHALPDGLIVILQRPGLEINDRLRLFPSDFTLFPFRISEKFTC